MFGFLYRRARIQKEPRNHENSQTHPRGSRGIGSPAGHKLVVGQKRHYESLGVDTIQGSAQEVVNHSVTGFVVDSLEEMVESVRRVHLIDPKRCRDHVVRNFDGPRMADGYLAAYEQILRAELSGIPSGDRTPLADTDPRFVTTPSAGVPAGPTR